jgi:DNA adenine methylase
MSVSKAEFYRWRAVTPDELDPISRAARFIYLNKTCFNGLYRVNKKGQFNSPFGGYSSITLADAGNLQACSVALGRATILSGDYRKVLADARKGDFIYMDPPYVPVGKFSDFNRYTSQPFSGANQEELAKIFADLDKRGCFVLLSNSKHAIVEELYRPYRQITVKMPRFVNCKGDKRGDVDELIVTNYEQPGELS